MHNMGNNQPLFDSRIKCLNIEPKTFLSNYNIRIRDDDSIENFFESPSTHIDNIYNKSYNNKTLSKKLNNKVLEDPTCELYNQLYSFKQVKNNMNNKPNMSDKKHDLINFSGEVFPDYTKDSFSSLNKNSGAPSMNTPSMRDYSGEVIHEYTEDNFSSLNKNSDAPQMSGYSGEVIHEHTEYTEDSFSSLNNNSDAPPMSDYSENSKNTINNMHYTTQSISDYTEESTHTLNDIMYESDEKKRSGIIEHDNQELTKKIFNINNDTDILFVDGKKQSDKYDEIEIIYNPCINVGVFGIPNSGKSTLTDALVGGEAYCIISREENDAITIVLKESENATLTVQQINDDIKQYNLTDDKIVTLAYNIPITNNFGKKSKNKHTFMFHDSPGYGGSNNNLAIHHMMNTLDVLDVLFLNIDCLKSVTSGDQKEIIDNTIRNIIKGHNHIKVIITINKIDFRTNEDIKSRDKYISDIKEQFEGKIKWYRIVEISAKTIFEYLFLMSHEDIDVDSTIMANVALSELSADWVEIDKTKLRSAVIDKIKSKIGKKSSYEVRSGYEALKNVIDEIVEMTGEITSERLELYVQHKQYNKTDDFEKILEHYKYITEQKSLDKPIESDYIHELMETNLNNTNYEEGKIKKLNLILIKYKTIISLYTSETKLINALEKFYFELFNKLYDNQKNTLETWYNLIIQCHAFISSEHIIKLLTKIYDFPSYQTILHNALKLIKSGEAYENGKDCYETKYIPTIIKIIKEHKTIDCKHLVINYIKFLFVSALSMEGTDYVTSEEKYVSKDALLLVFDKIKQEIPIKYKSFHSIKYMFNSFDIDNEEILGYILTNDNINEYTMLPGIEYLVDYINSEHINEPGELECENETEVTPY